MEVLKPFKSYKNFRLKEFSISIFQNFSPNFQSLLSTIFNHTNKFKINKTESRMSIKVFIGLSNEITKVYF